MTECDLERRTDGQPVSEYMWCRSHRRVVQECLAAKDSEIARLRGKFSEEVKQGALILELAADALDQALNGSDAARAKVAELSSALKGVIRAQHHRRYHRRDHEQCESCKAIGIARRALEKDGDP